MKIVTFFLFTGIFLFNGFKPLHAQNVGIGTTTPVSKLTIQTALNSTGLTHIGGSNEVIVDESIGGVSGTIGTVTNHAFRIKANNTGLLHIYPAGEVVVGSNLTNTFGRLTVETLNNSYGISHLGENGNILATRMGGTSAGIGTFSNTNMRLYSNGNSAMIIDAANGNIGIGTDAPTAKLHVAGNQKIEGSHTLELGVGFPKEANAGKIGYQAFSTGLDIVGAGNTSTSRLIKFWNEGGAEFAGNIGIGTPAAFGVRLHINQDVEALRLSGNQPYMTFFNGVNYKGYMRSIGADNIELGTAPGNTNGILNLTTLGIPRLSVNSNGQVSVNGPPAPYLSPAFTVKGNGIFSIANAASQWTFEATNSSINADGPCLLIYGDGFNRAKVDADGDWVPLSDRSLKDEIKEYKPVLEGIKKIQVSTYHLKHNAPGQKSFGLIAQNVAEYFPEIVSGVSGKDGKNLLGVSYGKTGVLAIKAIQEQQKIIEQQQSKIETLEKRLTALEKLLLKN
jgi:Chaperone of endosialidase